MYTKLIFTPATIVTLTRIFFTPILAIAFARQNWMLAFWLVVYAMLSDFLDGFLARTLQQTSAIGALLDTVADKSVMLVLVLSALILAPHLLSAWFVWLVLVRELCVACGALYLMQKKIVIMLAPLVFGKISMALQMGIFAWALAHQAYNIYFWQPSIFITALVLIFSVGIYAYKFLPLVWLT